ncbi:MAG: hypothetical protein OIF57_13000 [Marinobacterium sp.]|nr:hypothetical protein [Marinobacterium sp.]
MSCIYLARTNQKLNFARLHLDALRAGCDSTGWSKHILIESYNESVLFHLASAYDAFLHEIAERYSLDVSHIDSYRTLAADLESSGQECPELSELSVLENDPDSWLHKMVRAYEACWKATDRAAPVQSSSSVSEIHVAQINPSHTDEAAIVEECQSWLDALRDLIDRQRSGMQEW